MSQLENIEAIERRLWSSADNLRANANYASNEYCLPVMGLIFLRHAYSRFLAVKDDVVAGLPKRGGKTRALTKEDFSRKSALFLREAAQFDTLVGLGSLGTVMFISGDFWPLNTTLWVKEFKMVGDHFAFHLLENMQLEQYNGGAAVPTLNSNNVHRIEMLCPPKMLLQHFEGYSQDITRQIDILNNMTAKTGAARDLLLPRLMNGEITV